MAASYAYMGGAVMHYPDYRDADTGRMLIAAPGDDSTYAIVAVDGRFPVPPSDGRWAEASLPSPDPKPVSARVSAPAPEGGES